MWGQGAPQNKLSSNDDSDDSQDEHEATPTPAEKKRGDQASEVTQDAEEPPAPEDDPNDPYGVQNTSHTQDPAYATGVNEWEGLFNMDSDAEGQADVRRSGSASKRETNILYARTGRRGNTQRTTTRSR